MGIHVYEEEGIFQISTKNTTYLLGIADGKYLGNMYYGSAMKDYHAKYLLKIGVKYNYPSKLPGEKVAFSESFAFEYPAFGIGDYREDALRLRDSRGFRVCEPVYQGYRLYTGKPVLKGMPSTFEGEREDQKAQTLEIILKDELLGAEIILRYSIFEDCDAILRSSVIRNDSTEPLYIEKALSASLTMDNRNFSAISLHGSWGRERHISCRKVTEGKLSIASLEGKSSYHTSPFMALTTNGTNQTMGEVYAMNFVYSGNFLASVELNHRRSVRMSMGLHETGFEWVLKPGESFETPEAALVYSDHGLEKMTHTFHQLYKNHLIRSQYLNRKRPILINNWEATYFDFTDDKLVEIAREAKKLGIEMLVMDDGWFGHRNNEKSSLGDWYVNKDKIKGGLRSLAERINQEGLKFGIWMEPEMISPDSELYRKHPDWAIHVPGREPAQRRYQYMLDLSRQDVIDYIYEQISGILQSAPIAYVKWDMNRVMTDIGSVALTAEHMGELTHRYMLGVYQLQERIIRQFPDLLLENCSSGGARFDPGMLYYSPQIWTSDNQDPIERLLIQEGTALVYPVSCMGAHVCTSPNHCNGRVSDIETRAYVAMLGTFGYELDVTMLCEEEKEAVKRLNREYHQYQDLIREGTYYRLASFRENQLYDCWQIVNNHATEALVTYVQVYAETDYLSRCVRLRGLNPSENYRLMGTEEVYSGEMLMKAGYLFQPVSGDYQTKLLHFVKEPNDYRDNHVGGIEYAEN